MTVMRFATSMFVDTAVVACLIAMQPRFSADQAVDLTRIKLRPGGRLVSDPAGVLGCFDYRRPGKLKLSAKMLREGT
jgi:hypothetical protein